MQYMIHFRMQSIHDQFPSQLGIFSKFRFNYSANVEAKLTDNSKR